MLYNGRMLENIKKLVNNGEKVAGIQMAYKVWLDLMPNRLD